MTKKSLLRNAPFVFFLCLIYLFWPAKLVLTELESSSGFSLDRALVGQFPRVERPSDTLNSLWRHTFQEWAEAKVGNVVPLRGWLVRATNQIYYSVFGKSYMGGSNPLIIGSRSNIFSLSYILQYCDTYKMAPSIAEYEAWVARLDRTRKWLEGRGQTLIYFVSPSKAGYFPEDIPNGFDCEKNLKRPRYERAVAVLSRTNIPFVNATALISGRKGKGPVELFPLGGIHYNSLGAALTVNALTAKIGQLRGIVIPPISTAFDVSYKPGAVDRDVTDLLNLLFPNLEYPVPELRWGGYSAGTPVSLKVSFVGGSFVSQPARLMGLYRLFADIDHFSYFKLGKVEYPGQVESPIESFADYDSLFGADVIVLEENEETVLSMHGLAFLDEAERRQAVDRRRSQSPF